MRAIVVDDSKAMRTILRRILADVGFDEIFEACNGVDGLEVLRDTGAVDLALIDWNMPEMDGYQFLRLLRSRRDFDGVRVMMVTTESDIDRMTDALSAGADEYLMKPFDKDAVREKLVLMGVGS